MTGRCHGHDIEGVVKHACTRLCTHNGCCLPPLRFTEVITEVFRAAGHELTVYEAAAIVATRPDCPLTSAQILSAMHVPTITEGAPQ